MLWKSRRKASARSDDLSSFIGEGSEIEGKYSFTGTVLLNGKLQGEIVTSGALIVGEKGVINATIRAGSVVIRGEVVGNVLASERVELREGSRVFGDVEAPVVVIEEGVLFEGHCRMPKTTRPAPAAASRDRSVVSFPR